MISFDWPTAVSLLKPFAYYAFGISAYAIFVFHFYKFLAKKNIFDLNLRQYNDVAHPGLAKFFDIFLYLLEYVIIMPLCTFFWFFVLTTLLVFFAREHTVQSLLLVSFAIVSAIRVTAYYSEELSAELAKMLPFAILATFLIDAGYISLSKSFEIVLQIPSQWNIIFYYLIFTVILEFILTALYLLFGGDARGRRTI